jgi:hypothetical protein
MMCARLEVVLELPLDMARHAHGRQVDLECGKVFLNKLIKEGSLRAVPHVVRCTNARTGFPANR